MSTAVTAYAGHLPGITSGGDAGTEGKAKNPGVGK